jgi:hypothetical protein
MTDRSRRARVLPLCALLTVLACFDLQAQEEVKPPKIFTSEAVIEATMEGPWRTIEKNKESGDSWQGTFRFRSANGQDVAIPIEIRTRGLTRKRVCDFPPLRIVFDKEAAKGTEFRGAGSLKLVTHCLGREAYQQYYVKEYLSYRIYNRVTDLSFRVQGLDVTYVDSERDGKSEQRFGFLIEDPDDVAERNGLEKITIEEAKLTARSEDHGTARDVPVPDRQPGLVRAQRPGGPLLPQRAHGGRRRGPATLLPPALRSGFFGIRGHALRGAPGRPQGPHRAPATLSGLLPAQ